MIEEIEGICCKAIRITIWDGKQCDCQCALVADHAGPCSHFQNQKSEGLHHIHNRKKWIAKLESDLAAMGDSDGWGNFFSKKGDVGFKEILRQHDIYTDKMEDIPDTFLFAALLGDWTPRKGKERLLKELRGKNAKAQ